MCTQQTLPSCLDSCWTAAAAMAVATAAIAKATVMAVEKATAAATRVTTSMAATAMAAAAAPGEQNNPGYSLTRRRRALRQSLAASVMMALTLVLNSASTNLSSFTMCSFKISAKCRSAVVSTDLVGRACIESCMSAPLLIPYDCMCVL